MEFEGSVVNYVLCPTNIRVNDDRIKTDFNDNFDLVRAHLVNFGLLNILQELDKSSDKSTIKLEAYQNDKGSTVSLSLKKDQHFTVPKTF